MKNNINQLVVVVILLTSLAGNANDGGQPESGHSEIGQGLDYRFFSPSARVFFDTGSDNADEVDVFDNGSLTASINLLELIYRYELPKAFNLRGPETLYIGPALGFGLTAPANDSEDGTVDASDAPVFLISVGIFAEIAISADKNKSIILEIGRVTGFSADEGVGDTDDSASYIGLGFRF